MSAPNFISPKTIEQVTAKAQLLEVVQEYHAELKKRGASYTGKCDSCGSDKFTINPARSIVKCFGCSEGAGDSIGYLIKFRGKEFKEAVEILAKKYNIDIKNGDGAYQNPDAFKTLPQNGSQSAFRDAQLRASGIPDAAQQYTITDSNGETTINRYSAGSLDANGKVIPGYDMLIHYLDIDGNPILYTHHKTKKEIPYIRIRYQNPNDHLDMQKKPIRYASPKEGGNHLWIPEFIRAAIRDDRKLKTLSFIEGEKKADALCLAGIPAVGIAGIHNFANENEMPQQIERLIRALAIEHAVFFMDSDFDNLGDPVPTPADNRPRTFHSALLKFQTYILKYQHMGYNVQAYMAHGINHTYKGMDDLLVHLRDESSSEMLPDLSGDFEKAIFSHAGIGDHIKAFNITSIHDYRLKQIWNIQSNKSFLDHYKDRLKDLPEFRLGTIKYRYNNETNEFELAQQLQPDEQYWHTEWNQYGKPALSFFYSGLFEFLKNRGYGQMELSEGQTQFVHEENSIVTVVHPSKIGRYIMEMTRAIDEPKVMEMIHKACGQYTSAPALSGLEYVNPDFLKATSNRQFMSFSNGQHWEITKKELRYLQTRLCLGPFGMKT